MCWDWTLISVPSVYVSIFLPVSHCLHYCSFLVSLEIRWSPTSFFFFKIIWCINAFAFHMKFRMRIESSDSCTVVFFNECICILIQKSTNSKKDCAKVPILLITIIQGRGTKKVYVEIKCQLQDLCKRFF